MNQKNQFFLHQYIFTSTVYDSLYFLRKFIVIQSSVETDRTEIYTPRLSIGRNLQRPKKNHGLHEINMMMLTQSLTGDDLAVSFS